MSEIQDKLIEDMKIAMRNKDKDSLMTIRMALAALKQVEVDEQISVDDQLATSTITKMVKQRKDSAEQYQQAGRGELAQKELLEIKILENYLPQQLDKNELDALIDEAICASEAGSMKDMGKVMNVLRPKITGRADMGLVSQLVKSKLG